MLQCAVWIISQVLRRRGALAIAAAWIARFGYLAYVFYGLAEWFRPGTVQETLRRRRTLWYCLFAVGLGSFLSFVIGRLWRRERPFVQYPDIQPLIPHQPNASFPSNHAMNSMAVAIILLSRRNGWGIPFLAGSIILGASRVFSGLHYVSDVIGGMVLGCISAAAVRRSRLARQSATALLWGYGWLVQIGRIWRSRW